MPHIASKADKPKRGPKPETLKLEGSWEDAIGRAIRKPRPAGGWPAKTKPAKAPKGKKS